eukprot:scaffold14384_cov48-Attheya_sp.AAC.4
MVRLSHIAVLLAVTASGANAFAPAPAFGVSKSTTSLCMAEATAEKSMDMAAVRKSIENLNKDNFSATLTSIEPFLLNTGSAMLAKSLKRISRKAKEAGATVPADYTKDAKATAKKRAKQDAFIATKEEARVEAEAEAAAAVEAAAAAAAEAAAAPAEEAPAEE